MQSSINKVANFILIGLSLLVFSFSSFAKNHNDCPPIPFKVTPGQIISKGYGVKHAAAVKNAHVNLHMQISEAHVEEQFIQQLSEQKVTIQTNTQVKASSQRTKGINKQTTLECNEGFVTYLLYDQRSLATQISQILGDKNVRLKGADYLLNGRIISPFNNKLSNNSMAVVLIGTKEGNYLLSIGDKTLPVHKSEIAELIFWPNELHQTSDISLSLTNSNLALSNKVVLDLKLNNSVQQTRLYLCSEQGLCNTLYGQVKGSQQFTLLNTAVGSTQYQDGYIIAVDHDLLSHSKLALANASSQTDFYLHLLELVEGHPHRSDWVKLKIARNF